MDAFVRYSDHESRSCQQPCRRELNFLLDFVCGFARSCDQIEDGALEYVLMLKMNPYFGNDGNNLRFVIKLKYDLINCHNVQNKKK
jgi:hypothetical protein